MPENIVKFLKSKDYMMVNDNLGHGSFGKTVLLSDPFIDELFVAKKYEPEYPEIKEKFFSSFLQEIKILYKLNHPNIVRIYNYYAYAEQFTGYILMEYIDGETLGTYFENYDPLLTEGDPNSIFLQLISAFDYLEKNSVIHRDIREGNILINKGGIAKVIDFGLGKFLAPCDKLEDSLHSDVNRAGLDKLPKEYFKGEYSIQTDMFYLAELYKRLLNENKMLDAFLYRHILDKMLQEEAANRYGSFAAIIEEVSKKKLEVLEFSENDKKIYRDFAESLFGSISACIGERTYNDDPTTFKQKLQSILEHNLLEVDIQNLSDFIQTILTCNFKYFASRSISVNVVRQFYNWFERLNMLTQKLVLGNLVYKLSTIKIEPLVDIPF